VIRVLAAVGIVKNLSAQRGRYPHVSPGNLTAQPET